MKIGIIGATGYTGSELVRILANHPEAEISYITSEARAGENFSDVHPQFEGIFHQNLISSNEIDHHDVELVFLALPHGVSMEFVKKNHKKGFKIIDLSGDFRLSSANLYADWYKKEHIYPAGIENAVFGIPELYREEIKYAKIIANPGCYPTSAILAITPLLKNNLSDNSPIIIDSKSGVTGAGVKAKAVTHFPNVNDNFKAYGLKNHRHTIEIQEQLNKHSEQDVIVQFTPHLLPVDRGILTTAYLKPRKKIKEQDLIKIYKDFYKDSPFVRIRKNSPSIKDVRGTNYCDISPFFDERTGMIIIISAIDNLVKGAAGQAVQNMNIASGWKEQTGLSHFPLNP